MARLSIWVSGMDDPCTVDEKTWYVTIYDCNGDVLEWCGKRYVVMPAKCGHLEVDVPPGCYYIKAVWSFSMSRPGVYHVNHFTDAAIVQACCGQTTCVKLFNPSIHRCGVIFVRALNDLVRMKLLKADVVKMAEKTIGAALQPVPAPVKQFELGHEEEIDKLIKAAATKEPEPTREEARQE